MIKHRIANLAKLVAAPLVLASAVAQADQVGVLVFHDSERAPVLDDLYSHQNLSIRFIDLAKGRQLSERMTEQVNSRIPDNLSQAEVEAYLQQAYQGFANSPEMQEHMEAYRQFGSEVMLGVEHQIGRAPAIIFNEQYVIYGDGSLASAVRTYWAEVGTQ
jgi:hypothetical protein